MKALQSAVYNVTSINKTSSDGNALMTAITAASVFEFAFMCCTPITMGILMKGLQKKETYKGSKFIWFPVVAISSQAAGYLALISPLSFSLLPVIGSSNVFLLFILPTLIIYVVYLFLKFSSLSLIGILLRESVTDRCTSPDKAVITYDTKSCLKFHNIMVSNSGLFLLFSMTIDSLLVMLNSFMMYLSYSTNNISFFIYFLFTNINEILSLIYVCATCDDYFNAMKALLVPLR